MPERRYNEEELAAILRGAAEAQSTGPITGDEKSGYSLADIERLASEVGIDPKYIATAAENLPVERPNERGFRFFSAPIRQTIERSFVGNLDDLSWEESVDELRSTYHSNGTTATVGLSKEWIGGSDFRQVQLYASSRGGKTRLKINILQKDTIAVVGILGFFLTFVASLGLGSFLESNGMSARPGYVIGFLIAVFALTRGLAKWSAQNRQTAEKVLRRIEEFATSAGKFDHTDSTYEPIIIKHVNADSDLKVSH